MMAAALAFAAGILFASRFWHPAWMWLVSFVLVAPGSAWLARRSARLAYITALLALGLLAGLSLAGRDSEPGPDTSLLQFADGAEQSLTAYVVRDGIWRQSPFGGREQSVDLELESIGTGDAAQPMRGIARLTIYQRRAKAVAESDDRDPDDPQPTPDTLRLFCYGERLQLTAKLHRPRNYRNPGAFDYRAWLLSQNVVAVGSSRADTVQLLPGFAGGKFAALRSSMRRSVVAHIHRTWPEEQAALMDAMLIGERAFITRDVRAAFQRSGTYHILVVSGMNVGILAFVVFILLRRFRLGAGLATLATLVLATAYVFLADAGAPIVRSTLMLAVYLVTRFFYRDHAALNAVGVAALAILVADPRALFEPSFQLTFLSVLAISGIGLPLIERTSEPYRSGLRLLNVIGYDRALAPRVVQFRLDLRLIAGRLSRFFGLRFANLLVVGSCRVFFGACELLLISALMQVALALPMAWYFHRATALALPANTLVVPLTGVLMPSSVAAVALSYVSPTLARIPAVVAAFSLDAITGTVRLIGSVRVADVRVAMPTVFMTAFAVIAFALSLLSARRSRLFFAVGLLALIASAALISWPSGAASGGTGTLEITAIDVGQGDSFLIVSPEGKALLLDSGGHVGNSSSQFDVGEDVVSAYLWQRGINRLDAVAISHAHSDHMGGMRAVVRNFHPRELWMGRSLSTPELDALREDAGRDGVRWIERTRGDVFVFGGAKFEVFAPARDWELKSRVRDDDALILRVSYGENSVLLPGDAGRKIEQKLLGELSSVDLLKIAHHGSVSSTSPELLQAAHPGYAIISVGARNSFGHPRPEVLSRLQQARVATYRTDTMGAVSFYLDGKSVRVTTTLR